MHLFATRHKTKRRRRSWALERADTTTRNKPSQISLQKLKGGHEGGQGKYASPRKESGYKL